MTHLRSIRQPIAYAILIAVVLTATLTFVVFFTSVDDLGLTTAARIYGSSLMPPYLVVLVVAAILPCVVVAPRVPHAQTLTLAGAMVLFVGALFSLILSLLVFITEGLAYASGFLYSLPVIGIDIIAGVVLWNARRDSERPMMTPYGSMVGEPTGLSSQGSILAPAQGSLIAPTQPGQGSMIAPAPQAGAVWGSAQQAAAGQSVTGWGAQGTPGWTPGQSGVNAPTPTNPGPMNPGPMNPPMNPGPMNSGPGGNPLGTGNAGAPHLVPGLQPGPPSISPHPAPQTPTSLPPQPPVGTPTSMPPQASIQGVPGAPVTGGEAPEDYTRIVPPR